MDIFVVLIALLFVLSLSFTLWQRFNINAAFTTIIAISIIATYVYFSSLFQLLKFGAITAYLLILISTILTFEKIPRDKIIPLLKMFLSNSGILYFLIFSIFFIIFYTIKNPQFDGWDEMSAYAPFFKNIYLTSNLHIFSDSNLGAPQYMQGMSVIYYFFSWLAPTFSEKIPLIVINIVSVSGLATVFSSISKLQKPLQFCASILLILALCLFSSVFPFYSVYLDLLLGIIFGSALIVTINVDINESKKKWILLPIIFLLCILKDIGLVLSYSVLIVWMFRCLSIKKQLKKNFISIIKLSNIFKYFKYIFLGFLIPIFVRWSWLKLLDLNNIISTPNMPFSKYIDSFVGVLSQSSQFYQDVPKVFLKAFLGDQPIITWPIELSIFSLFVILTIIGLVLIFTSKNGLKNLQMKTAFILMPFLFIVYEIIIFFLSITNFSNYESYTAASFSRYTSTFFIAWFIFIFFTALSTWETKLTKNAIFNLAMIIVSLVIILFNQHPKVFKQDFFITRNKSEIAGIRNDIKQKINKYSKYFSEQDNLWVISQGTKGIEYLVYHYELMPKVQVIGKYIRPIRNGSLPFVSWSLGPPKYENDVWSTNTTPIGFLEELKYHNIKYLLIDKADSYLYDTYSNLFSDKLEDSKSGITQLYKINNETNILDPVI